MYLDSPKDGLFLDIQFLEPYYGLNYLGSQEIDKVMLNSGEWDILKNSGFCDGGVDCGPLMIIYQTVRDNYRYAFVFNNMTELNQFQKSIVETFKFTN